MEEPECHLSHTSLRELLALIDESLEEGQQAFISTHSPYVLNRLGLDKMSVMAAGSSPACISRLSPETTRYFKKLSGYDTLRIVLAKKIVIVEGPTDEMVFDWAFRIQQ
jgi:predicted ATP-dependent endonuclease of OLD family